MLKLKLYPTRSNNYYVRGAIKGVTVFESTGTDDKALAEEYLQKRILGVYRDNIIGTDEWTAISPEMERELATLGQRANNRNQKKGREERVTPEMVHALYLKQRGKCAVSGITFRLDCLKEGDLTSRAFAPSLDRRNNSLGYVAGNVRLVCRITNFALNTWGDAALLELSLAVANMWESMCSRQLIRGPLVRSNNEHSANDKKTNDFKQKRPCTDSGTAQV